MAAIAAVTPLFDGEEVDLNPFLRKVWLRAEAFGFTGVLVVQDAEQTPRNITREFGCLTLAQVQAAAIVDIQAADRRTQAQELLRQLIQASCTPRIVDRLEHRKEDYMLDVAQPPNAADLRFSSSCLLFSLIGMVSVQTRATVSSLMNRLDGLEGLMVEMKSNVRDFNTEVENICDALRARRKDPPELLTKLFLGYSSCEDEVFKQYIKRKEEGYKDGTITLVDNQLMTPALKKFKILHDKKKVWMKKSKQQ
jgi:hypothetical protein